MKESDIEKRLCKAVKNCGGMAIKMVSPSMDGLPDRIILLSKGRVCFTELKAPGKKPRPLQLKRKEQLEMLGFKVYIIDSMEQIGEMLDEISAT